MQHHPLIKKLAFGRDLSQSIHQGYSLDELSLIKKEHYYYEPLFEFLSVMGKNHGGLLDNEHFLLFKPDCDFFKLKKYLYELRDEEFFDGKNFLEANFLLEAHQGVYYF